MKSMQKASLLGVGSVLVTLIILISLMTVGIIPLPSFLKRADSDNDTLGKAIKIIYDHPTDVMLLGDDIIFQRGFKAREITEVNDEALKRDTLHKYSFLIINDLQNNVNLTQDNIEMIRDYIYNKHYTVFYLGDKYLSAWDDSQFITNVEGSRSVVFQNEVGQVVRITGLWGEREAEMMQEYPNILGDVIIYQIEDFIRKNN